MYIFSFIHISPNPSELFIAINNFYSSIYLDSYSGRNK